MRILPLQIQTPPPSLPFPSSNYLFAQADSVGEGERFSLNFLDIKKDDCLLERTEGMSMMCTMCVMKS